MLAQINDLTNKTLLQWHNAIAAIFDRGINDESISYLIDTIRLIVDGGSYSLIIYPDGSQPYPIFSEQRPESSPIRHLDTYIHRAYLLNPFYQLTLGKPVEGVYSLSEVTPHDFQQSEYYRIYYNQMNFHDEICLIIPTLDNASIQISVKRMKEAPPFTDVQREFCQRIFSTVRAILLKWWNTSQEGNPEYFLEPHMENALSNFGSSMLTKRETQVLQMVLRGYDVKTIALKLNIRPETIKHHRKNIYAKLDVSSQAEMFHLFIDSLRMMTPSSPPDPLINYLQLPSQHKYYSS